MIRRPLHAGALLGALVLLGACPGEPEEVVVQGTAVDHGRALFDDPDLAATDLNSYACSTCHDEGPTSDSGVLRPGAPMAGVLGRPSYWGGMELDLLGAINHCLFYFMLRDQPLSKDDVEARAIYAYLESLSPGGADQATDAVPFTVPVMITDVPNGDPTAGSGVYDRACAQCHGAAHSGEGRLVERAPVLPEQTLEEHPLGVYTEAERRLVFVEKVRHGAFLGYTGQMPPLSLEVLPDEQLGHLLAFLVP
jgi:thiosulfate dehydrogenase